MSLPLGHFDCSACGDKHPVYRDPYAKNRLLLPTTCSKGIPNQPTPDQSENMGILEESMGKLLGEIFELAHKHHWSEATLKLDDLFVEQNNLHKLITTIRGDKR